MKNQAYKSSVLVLLLLCCAGASHAQEVPFRMLIDPGQYHRFETGKPRKYSFGDWEELKGGLSTECLRGNDIGTFLERFGRAGGSLVAVGRMELSDQERQIARAHLIAFLDAYIHDPRYTGLLDPLQKHQPKGVHTPLEWIANFPYDILCVIARLGPGAEETGRICGMLMKYRLIEGEYWLGHFMADLHYFGHLSSASAFLESLDYSALSTDEGRKMMRLALIASRAGRAATPRDAWLVIIREFTGIMKEWARGSRVFSPEDLPARSIYWAVVGSLFSGSPYGFQHLCPEPDFGMLIGMAGGRELDAEDRLFLMFLLQEMAMHQGVMRQGRLDAGRPAPPAMKPEERARLAGILEGLPAKGEYRPEYRALYDELHNLVLERNGKVLPMLSKEETKP